MLETSQTDTGCDANLPLLFEWAYFRLALPNLPPPGITIADIKAIREVLRIPKPKPSGGVE